MVGNGIDRPASDIYMISELMQLTRVEGSHYQDIECLLSYTRRLRRGANENVTSPSFLFEGAPRGRGHQWGSQDFSAPGEIGRSLVADPNGGEGAGFDLHLSLSLLKIDLRMLKQLIPSTIICIELALTLSYIQAVSPRSRPTPPPTAASHHAAHQPSASPTRSQRPPSAPQESL